MTKLPPALYRTTKDKTITMDLETRTIEGNMDPICLSIYDGNEKFSFFIEDYKDSEEMIVTAMNHVMKRKYLFRELIYYLIKSNNILFTIFYQFFF